jgi:hypothetical protein
MTLTSSLPNMASIFRNGISIQSFSLNSKVQLNVNFNANVLNTQYQVRGIHLQGGNVGAGTKITISNDSQFFIRGYASSGISLMGAFPEKSEIHIYDNDFDCATAIGDDTRTYGIESNGDKNHLHIYGNRFSPTNGSNITYSIWLQSSVGIDNEVSDNKFYPSANVGAFEFLFLSDFQNAKVCSNIGGSIGVSRGFEFWGTNAGLDFTGNEISATGIAVDVFSGSLVGPQSHKGNKWYPVIVPAPPLTLTFRSVNHALCQTPGLAPFNKFTVHSNQSIWNDIDLAYDFFSEYHPENVDPDQMNEFFEIQAGTPASACVDRFNTPSEENSLENSISNNLIPTSSDNPALAWNAKSYLYRKLTLHPYYWTFCKTRKMHKE